MIVEQRIWKAKRGHRAEAVALSKAECKRMGVSYRVTTLLTHPGDVFIVEYQFADLAEHARVWAQWAQDPQARAFEAQFLPLVEREHRVELLQVL